MTPAESAAALALDADTVRRAAESAAHALRLGLPRSAVDDLEAIQAAAWRISGLAEDALRLARQAVAEDQGRRT